MYTRNRDNIKERIKVNQLDRLEARMLFDERKKQLDYEEVTHLFREGDLIELNAYVQGLQALLRELEGVVLEACEMDTSESSELFDLLLNAKYGSIDDRSLKLFESIRKKENAR